MKLLLHFKSQHLMRCMVMLMVVTFTSLTAMADNVITFTGGTATNVYNYLNTPAIYFSAPTSQNGASKLLLKSIQIYTFLDGTGQASNLQNQTVYLGVSTTKPTNLTVGGTGQAFTAASGIEIFGFSSGVTYNSEGYTTFTFSGQGLEIDPSTEYVFYLTKSNTLTEGFTYYNYRIRVWEDNDNSSTHYYGQEGNLLKWMPFYVVTLTDKEEDVTATVPNPAMTEEEILADLNASGGTGSSYTYYLKSFGFTTPNGSDVSSYTTNAVKVYMGYNSNTRSNNYYLVIAKSNIASANLDGADIIAVSSNTNKVSSSSTAQSTGPGYRTFNFSDPLKFRPNTTYYVYFATSAPTSSGFSPAICPVQVKGSTYQPTTYLSTSYSTNASSYSASNAYWPAFEIKLTKVTASDPFVDGELQTLWSSYNNDHPWRIPALARTKRDHLVAIAGWLICDKDVGNGECHLASKTSLDNGVTWSRAGAAVATGSGVSGAYDCGYGDAAVVADRESDRILVMCATGNVFYPNSTRSNPIRFARIYGTDSESGTITWGSPTDVTTAMYAVNTSMNKGFFASGRICQSRVIKVGDYYRLYSALTTNLGNIVVYSDDFGETWTQLGGTAVSDGDEAKIEEMPNGDIFITSRKASGRYLNLFKFTDLASATGSWGTRQTLSLGTGTATNGEILFVNVKKSNGDKCILALQSMPSVTGSSPYPRKKVYIYWREVSADADLSTIANWTSGWSTSNSYQVSYSGSAYSTMIVTPGDKIGFMLENNYYDVNSMPRSDIQYVNLPISMITNGAYTEIISEYVLPYRETYSTTKNLTDMRFDKVTVKREDMTNGERYYTLCLPYDMTTDEIAEAGLTSVETLGEYTGTGCQFVTVNDGIKAFQPYVVMGGDTEGLNLTAKNILIEKSIPALGEVTSNGATFKGNLTEPYDPSEGGTVNAYGYSAKNGNFAKAKSGSTLHAYCAYIIAPDSETAKSLAVSFDEPLPTGIDAMADEAEMQKGVMYNLAGQRVSDSYKGIVIMNGKKYLKK